MSYAGHDNAKPIKPLDGTQHEIICELQAELAQAKAAIGQTIELLERSSIPFGLSTEKHLAVQIQLARLREITK